MEKEGKNVALEKSFAFAVRAVKCYRFLFQKRDVQPIANQFMRATTSVGANLTEAQDAQSRADFTAKAFIALKEAWEAQYWIRLMAVTEILSSSEAESLEQDCRELIRLLTAIVKTTRSNS